MSLDHYIESSEEVSTLACDLTRGYIPPDASIHAQLNQALATIERLQKENTQFQNRLVVAEFTVDQSNAARDDITQKYQESLEEIEEKDNTIIWLQDNVQTLREKSDYVTKGIEWMTDVNNNPTFEPAKVSILMYLYPFARQGKWFRLSIKGTASKIGVSRYTVSTHLHKLGDLGLIELEGDTWFTGKKDNRGRDIYKSEVVIKFSEELLRFPGEIHIEKEDKRKGNGKDGGKNKKPKACPECNQITVNELDAYQCRNCNHQWQEGEPKDANKDAAITPWDYGQVEEDAAELRTEFAAAEQTNDSTTSNMDNTHTPGTTLFPDESPPVPAVLVAAYDGPVPPPDRACFECQLKEIPKNWKWDESIENYVCVNEHKKEVA